MLLLSDLEEALYYKSAHIKYKIMHSTYTLLVMRFLSLYDVFEY